LARQFPHEPGNATGLDFPRREDLAVATESGTLEVFTVESGAKLKALDTTYGYPYGDGVDCAERGCWLTFSIKGSPAYKAGLREYDRVKASTARTRRNSISREITWRWRAPGGSTANS